MSRLKSFAWIAVPLIVAGGALAFAHQGTSGHGGPMCGHDAEMHLDHVDAMLTRIKVSDAQKTQAEGILKNAFEDLASTRDAHHDAFGELHQLLLAPSVDRARIEVLRARQIQALDEASKRVAGEFADAAEVLSPEQRAALAAEMRRMHGG